MQVLLFVLLALTLLNSCRPSSGDEPEPELRASPAEMGGYAQEAVDLAQRDFQVKLDYSEESIRRLEDLIARQGQVSAERRRRFALLWGAYLGEVARRHHGAEWLADGVLKFGTGELSPPSKVNKRFINGAEDNVYFYYQMIFNRDKLRRPEFKPPGAAKQ